MAHPTEYPHSLQGAVVLTTGSVQPGVEALLEHQAPGKTVVGQAAYYDSDARTDDSLMYPVPADFAGSGVEIEVAGGRLRLAPSAEGAGAHDLCGDKPTTPIASSNAAAKNKAADGDAGTYWLNANSEPPAGAWWGIKMPAAETVLSFSVVWYSSSYTADIEFQSSPDGAAWSTEETFAKSGTTQSETLAAAATAKYFRLRFANPTNATYVVLKEVSIFRADISGFAVGSAHATTAASFDTTLWSGGVAFSADVAESPGTTYARFLMSVDGGTSWRQWDGAAWAAAPLTAAAWADYDNIGTLTDRTPADWAALLALGVGNTLDMAIQLETADGGATPSVGAIRWSFQTGTFRKVVDSSEAVIREYNDGKTVGVYNSGAVARDFYVSILTLPST